MGLGGWDGIGLDGIGRDWKKVDVIGWNGGVGGDGMGDRANGEVLNRTGVWEETRQRHLLYGNVSYRFMQHVEGRRSRWLGWEWVTSWRVVSGLWDNNVDKQPPYPTETGGRHCRMLDHLLQHSGLLCHVCMAQRPIRLKLWAGRGGAKQHMRMNQQVICCGCGFRCGTR